MQPKIAKTGIEIHLATLYRNSQWLQMCFCNQ
jgi:hypothetical protein